MSKMFDCELKNKLANVGIKIPEIYFPTEGTDLEKWAVIACDQHTSQPEYWDKAYEVIGDAPSTLNIIFPEIYLKDDDFDQRIRNINKCMNEYLDNNTLESIGEGFMLLEREVSTGLRKGLVVAMDLEQYDFNKGSDSMVRATEETIISRIPPRVQIRKDAPVETPHIMILIDDADKTVIEPLYNRYIETDTEAFYDVELMLDGGRQRGWHVIDDADINAIADALTELKKKTSFLYAMGDGNHSLATAKQHWENTKQVLKDEGVKDDVIANHPARYALVELVNLFDESLVFEPIHRILLNAHKTDLMREMKNFIEERDMDLEVRYYLGETGYDKLKESFSIINELDINQCFAFVADGAFGMAIITGSKYRLPVGVLQAFLDDFLKKHEETEIDYVHEAEIVRDMACQSGNFGFLLPAMDKADLFPTVNEEGALPRKTFSMGEAQEKRYYIECRKIVE